MGWWSKLFGGGASDPPADSLEAELAHWRIAEVEGDEDARVVVRIRLERPELPDLAAYATAVTLSWSFTGDTPSPDAADAMRDFEGELDALEDHSYLIMVRTGLGERSWLYYTRDPGRFTAAVDAQAARSKAPVRVEAEPDPSWSAWDAVAARVRARE